MPNDPQAGFAPRTPSRVLAALALAYVVAVLGLDLLHAPRALHPASGQLAQFLGDWLRAPQLRQLDWYKLLFWFLAPFFLCLRWMDWGAFGLTRWKKADWWLLGGLVVVGLAAVLMVPHVEALQRYYPSMKYRPWGERLVFVQVQLVWVTSWLLGWEFMHRYFLLRHMNTLIPRFGWMAVPVVEAAYHITKHPAEMAGMFVIGVVFTYWCTRRRNILLPFLVHLAIELALPLVRILL